MKKNAFIKVYRLALLPLYLFCCVFLFINFIIDYGLPQSAAPISCTITIALTEFTYLAYISLIIYLFIKLNKKTKMVYNLNMLLLFTFPLILQIDTVITQVIFYEINYYSDVSLLSYMTIYLFLFCLFFLPQVIYFKKRKYLFAAFTNQ